jgi:hypothetical protein
MCIFQSLLHNIPFSTFLYSFLWKFLNYHPSFLFIDIGPCLSHSYFLVSSFLKYEYIHYSRFSLISTLLIFHIILVVKNMQHRMVVACVFRGRGVGCQGRNMEGWVSGGSPHLFSRQGQGFNTWTWEWTSRGIHMVNIHMVQLSQRSFFFKF